MSEPAPTNEGAKEYEMAAADKANKALGDVMDGDKHRLSSESKGTEILNTYELAELSNLDALTGVGNSRAQEQFFQEDEKQQNTLKKIPNERRGTGSLFPSFGLILYMDADGLKNANYISRETGDTLLKKIADAAKSVAGRPYDKVCRQGGGGGDEFAVFLPGDTKDDMESIVIKFVQALKGVSDATEVSASLSIGTYGNGRTARETVALLDKKLEDAKLNRGIRGGHVDTIYVE